MNNNSLIAVWKIIPAKHLIIQNKGIKGWRGGESGRLPPMWPWFKSGRRRHLWVKFVGGSLPCSERFFSSYSGFPLSSKTNISKFQFAQESGRQRTTLWMCYLQIITIILLYQLFTKLLHIYTKCLWPNQRPRTYPNLVIVIWFEPCIWVMK